MPIYEYYCSRCHTIFNFLSRKIRTRKRPACPRCGKPDLKKKVSSFSVSRNRPEPSTDEPVPDLDPSGMEHAMAAMAREAEGCDEEDPRALGRLMRRFFESSGLRMGEGMEEALRRIEAGEDPDKIEEEMGDLLEGEEPLLAGGERGLKGLRRRIRPPAVDETLYEL